jgi:CheY-like chemotaxis protein
VAKILYIEDNTDNAYMLSRRLRRRGHDVEIAETGEQGLIAAQENRPDLIIMDLVLPEMDGWETTRKLKMNKETSRVPVLALSSSAMASDRDRAFESGCDDFDSKPVNMTRLYEKIEKLLATITTSAN